MSITSYFLQRFRDMVSTHEKGSSSPTQFSQQDHPFLFPCRPCLSFCFTNLLMNVQREVCSTLSEGAEGFFSRFIPLLELRVAGYLQLLLPPLGKGCLSPAPQLCFWLRPRTQLLKLGDPRSPHRDLHSRNFWKYISISCLLSPAIWYLLMMKCW